MEEITRLVDDSMARHGFDVSLDHRRLVWSRWFRCESSFSLLLVPSAAGIYTLAEEMVAPGETAATGGKRILAVFQISEAEDLCVALSRDFAPAHPLRARLSAGSCFVRFVTVTDPVHRKAACAALNQWIANSAETATGIVQDPGGVPTCVVQEPASPSMSATDSGPPALPAGF
ncbi:MAG TPA: hypothetical protein VFA40_21030 [Terriglobales bacterium]|jgi:hypothetical protein|nr:hypothetical protein [Terriglobales bacterium]